MIQLLAAVGWGLLACGATTHLWHQERLRELMAMHFDHERVPAAALTATEGLLAISIPVALLLNQTSLLRVLAVAGLVLAVGFATWIARLLVTGSDLPCACSFSSAPTSVWSLARACAVGLVAIFGIELSTTPTAPEHIATLAVGWAVASAIFVLPEAVSWPEPSRALLARVDAHTEQ